MGYDFVQAVADLLDNSIAANATHVWINVSFDGDNSWISIADNGDGIPRAGIAAALRFGSERDYADDDLGKFGLGLKTASLSQCRHLSVLSRSNPMRFELNGYCWDLDHIEKTDQWEILPLTKSDVAPETLETLKNSTGTVVVWQKLDRILGYRFPDGEAARRRLTAMCRDLERHIAMVFHRFIDSRLRRKRLQIFINGNPIAPWDPFCTTEPKTKTLSPITIPISSNGISGEVKLEPFVLPHQSDFTSSEAFSYAGGPSNWLQQQGFYIYRANRLIQSGGWCRLRTNDEHLKLARVALSFSPRLDDAFNVNVAKMRVHLPNEARDQIADAIKPLLRIAQETYRKKSDIPLLPRSNAVALPVASARNSMSLQAPSDSSRPAAESASNGSSIIHSTASSHTFTLDEVQLLLEDTCEPNELPTIRRVFKKVRSGMSSGVRRK